MHDRAVRAARAIAGASVLLALGGGFIGELSAGELRTWSRPSGTESFQAELLMAQDRILWFRSPQGNVFDLPAADLSASDRAVVADIRQRRQQQVEQMLAQDPTRIRYGAPRQLAHLSSPAVCESSGLAASHRHPGLFWTHNDSGDAPRVYLFDRQGTDRGSFLLADEFAYDWEDIAAFRDEQKCYLLLCDVGNNVRAAPVQMLHVVEEPPLDSEGRVACREMSALRTFFIAHEDDFHDCEAVAVDPTDQSILLATKEREAVTYVYRVPWPGENHPPNKALIARRIAAPAIPPVTAMDVSPDGRRAVLLTYGNAFEFVRSQRQSWAEALAEPPREIEMPERVQGESICYGPDGKTLYLTSEKLPTPFWEVPVEQASRTSGATPLGQ